MTTKSDQGYLNDMHEWRRALEQRLRAENGWLALAGLIWLHEGQQRVGKLKNSNHTLAIEAAPDDLGQFALENGRVHFQPNPDLRININDQPASQKWLAAETDPHPDFIAIGDLRIVVVQRGGRFGLRIWDNSRPERVEFPGRSWYPIEPGFRLRARFIPADSDRKVVIPDVLGNFSEEQILGELLVEYSGEMLRLQVLDAAERKAFLIFADRTNGETTYPGGRFMVVELGASEEIELDFNRAYNPPCAFTPYATCPLPPDPNRLSIRIEAGERFDSSATSH